MTPKFFTLVLHSHIPYVVAHGEWPHGMDWLYEAAAETYVPLLEVFRRLAAEGISPQVTVGLTPVLMAQLKSAAFVRGFDEYLDMKTRTAVNDRQAFLRTGRDDLAALASFWEGWYTRIRDFFHDPLGSDIVDGFRRLQDEDHIEVLTSGATHGYFALLSRDESVRTQVRQGKIVYEKYMGRPPRGFWIPECAYRPSYAWRRPLGDGPAYPRQGVDEILGAEGPLYFFVDTHLLKGGETKGVYADRFPALKMLWDRSQAAAPPAGSAERTPYLPYRAHPSATPFFVRDDVSGAQVWSRFMGYPGDGRYLEFHKKHFPGGLRYWRITAPDCDLADKKPYDPARTAELVRIHAGHFAGVLNATLAQPDRRVVVSLYDTELFGHWWFEGPAWLEEVLRLAASAGPKPLRASSVLETIPPETLVALPEGSWGQGGFHNIWLNPDTAWIWEKIYRVEDAASRLGGPVPADLFRRRLLKQFLREKLLLESSDWPFLISTWSARDYAERRASEHFERADALAGWLEAGRALTLPEIRRLETWESEDALFDEIVTEDGTVI